MGESSAALGCLAAGEAGESVEQVSRSLGHRFLAVTTVYLRQLGGDLR